MHALDRLQIRGFKSIREADLELPRLSVMIGANGAGKSNLIAVFELLHALVHERLQVYVQQAGGADSLLHFGRKNTDELKLRFWFGRNAYECQLLPTAEDSLVFGEETLYFQAPGYSRPYSDLLGSGQLESRLPEAVRKAKRTQIAHHVLTAFESWRVYHFHDTSAAARVKQTGDLEDNEILREHAGNLAAFLYRLRKAEPDVYANIVETIRMVTPFFGKFRLRPSRLNEGKIRLEWQERDSDVYFDAHALSDGTLRFICLATLLLQPNPPTTILLDEPELGLHPFAIAVLADLLRAAAQRTQVIASTQSVTLVNQLSPENLIVVDREGRESCFRRPGADEVASWLDDYSLGELWEKNVIGGRPGG
jgi:predicted ATPase